MKNFKFGFTLAEVLITLAIIGVVAALTLPTLITNYEKKEVSTKVKKAYAELVQAIKLSEVDNGPITAKLVSTEKNAADRCRNFAEKYLIKYFNGISYCDSGQTNDECAKYAGCGYASQNYKLNNGTMIGICAYNNSGNIYINIVTKKKEPVKPRYKFSFQIDEKGEILPNRYQPELTREDYINGYTSHDNITLACNKNANVSYPLHACTSLLYIDGFEFKDDYPW